MVSPGRTAGGTAGRVASEVGDRLQEALVTLLGAKGDTLASALIGLGVVGAVVLAARADVGASAALPWPSSRWPLCRTSRVR